MTNWIDQLAWHLMLLAEGPRWRSMGSGFRGRRARLDAGDLTTALLILAVVLVVVYLLSRILARQERRKPYNSPRALFRSLAKAHGLDWASRRLLRQVARWQRLAHPARLFLEPSRFDPVNLGPQLRTRLSEVHALRDRIFAAKIEELDLDRPGGQSPTRRERPVAARTSPAPGEPQAKPVGPLPTLADITAPPIQTTGANLQNVQEGQPTFKP